jgi:hypothetical protein
MDADRLLAPPGGRHAPVRTAQPTALDGVGAAVRRPLDIAARTHPEDLGAACRTHPRHPDHLPRPARRTRRGDPPKPARRVGHRRHRRALRNVHPALEGAAAPGTRRPGFRRRGGPRPDRSHGHLPPAADPRPTATPPVAAARMVARTRSRAVHRRLRRAVRSAAENHVRAVASQYAGNQVLDIRAHTVADLATGFS